MRIYSLLQGRVRIEMVKEGAQTSSPHPQWEPLQVAKLKVLKAAIKK
jgi:hypothetical protein